MTELLLFIAYFGSIFVAIYAMWYEAKSFLVKLGWFLVILLPFGWIIFLVISTKKKLTNTRRFGVLLTLFLPFLFILYFSLEELPGVSFIIGMSSGILLYLPFVLFIFFTNNNKINNLFLHFIFFASPIIYLITYLFLTFDDVEGNSFSLISYSYLLFSSIPLVLSILYFHKRQFISKFIFLKLISALVVYLVLSFFISNRNLIIIELYDIKQQSKIISDDFYSSLMGDEIPLFSGYIKADSICTLSFVDTIYLGKIHLEKSKSLEDGTNVFIGSSDKEVHIILGEKKKLYAIDESAFFTYCRWVKIDYDFDRCDNIECNAFADTDRIIIKPSFNIRINNMYGSNLPKIRKRIKNHNNFKETLKIAFLEKNIFYIYYCDLYFKVEMDY